MRLGRGKLARVLALGLLTVLAVAAPANAQKTDIVGLMRQMTELTKVGKLSQAMAVGHKLVAEVEKMAGRDHPLTAAALFALSEIQTLQGQYDEAEAVLKRVLAIRQKALGPEHADVATTLASLANIAIARGHYDEAERTLKQVLAVRERSLGARHHDTAMARVGLGRIRHAQARYGEAEELFGRALEVLRKSQGQAQMLVPTVLNNLAVVYQEQGRLALAEGHLREALALQEKHLGPDSLGVASFVNNLAVLHARQGRYAEAEVLQRRALRRAEETHGPDHADVAFQLGNLALLFTRQGRASEAERLLRRALAIEEKAFGPRHFLIATRLGHLANAVSMQQGRAREHEALVRRALAMYEALFGAEHPFVATSLADLAQGLHEQRRFEEALPVARRALAIREKTLGGEHFLVASSLNVLGVVLDDLNRRDEAEPLLRRALSINEKALGNNHPDVALVLNNLGTHHLDLRSWPAAYADFKRTYAIWVGRKGAVSAIPEEARRAGTDAQDLTPYRGLIIAAYRMAEGASSEASSRLRAEAFEAAQWAGGATASRAIARMAARAAAGGGALGDLVRRRQDLAEQAAATDRALIELMSKSAKQRSPGADAALRQRTAALAAQLKDVDASLAIRFPQYTTLVSSGPVALSDAGSLVGPDEALLVFAPTNERTFLWAVTRDATRWVEVPLSEKAIEDHVAALRCGLDAVGAWRGKSAQRCMELLKVDASPGDADPPFDVARAHALYRALLGQVEDLIERKHLLVVPAGPLASLPFHVLVAEASPAGPGIADTKYAEVAWLSRRHAISMLPSVASLAALRRQGQQSQAKAPFIGFGNPLLAGPSGSDQRAWARQSCSPASFSLAAGPVGDGAPLAPNLLRGGLAQVEALRRQPPLPETADELCTVARLLGAPEDSVHLGAGATERTIKSLSASGALRNARFVHFATHGLLASEAESVSQAGAEAALLLTPPAQASADDDGLLTASEVAQLKLDADWVILSACNTAAGDRLDAEALSGLARAFFYAGSRALLASHWYVDSDATVVLVTKTFGAIEAEPGLGRAEALRRAMLALIEAGGRTAHPSYWAPFVVVGEGGR